MSAFIKLNKQDAYISTYNAYKAWNLNTGSFIEYGVELYTATSGSKETTGIVNIVEKKALYNSIKQLYYSGTTSSPSLTSSSFEDYQQTTLFPSMSRALDSTALVLTIPQNIFGDAIRPGTFTLGTDEPIYAYVSGGYIATGYFQAGLPNGYNLYDDSEGKVRVSGSNEEVGDIIYPHGIITITDATAIANVERLLARRWMIASTESYVSASYIREGYFVKTITGAVVEAAGCYLENELDFIDAEFFSDDCDCGYLEEELAYLDPNYFAGCECYLEDETDYLDAEYFTDCDTVIIRSCSGQPMVSAPPIGFNIRWNSTLPVYTRTYRCRVRNEQLNHTYNNSASSGSLISGSEWLQVNGYDEQTFLPNVTGSYFQPYVTAVGLYNDAQELIAVGKLAQPTPKSKYTDMTFVINLDI